MILRSFSHLLAIETLIIVDKLFRKIVHFKILIFFFLNKKESISGIKMSLLV